MALHLNHHEIKSVENESPDGTFQRVKLDDGGDLTVHRDILSNSVQGRSYSFPNLPFETEADRKRSKGMIVTATVAEE